MVSLIIANTYIISNRDTVLIFFTNTFYNHILKYSGGIVN